MFTFGERLGMLFPIMGGCLSAIAASLVLLLAVLRWLRRTASGRRPTPDASDNIFFLSLMFADLIQALGETPTIRWMADGVVTEKRLCTAQGLLKNFGANGVAFSSVAIAAHTFCVLVLRWSTSKFISKLIVLVIWISITLITTIPFLAHVNERFYGSVGYWCWVRKVFKTEQLVTAYIWLWSALVFMAIFYTIMFAVLRGWFIVENGVWYWYKNYLRIYGARRPVEETEEEKDSKAIANLLLLYPVVYLICIFPLSVARWLFFSGHKVKYQGTLFANTLFSLCGSFNATLFFFTRPDLVVGSADSPPPDPAFDHQALRDGELASHNSGKFGFPPRQSPVDYAPPDLEKDYDGEFNPYDSMLLAEGANNNIRASSHRMESDAASLTTYLSGERSLPLLRQ